jgi:MFS family permease
MNFKLLKQKDFSLLMLGKLISLIGTNMQSFALSLYVLNITGSSAKFATVISIAIIPQLLLGPVAGVFVDWMDRKKLLVYLDIFAGVVVGAYAFAYFYKGSLSVTSIYGLVIVLSILSVIFQPAAATVIPVIMNKEDLVDANGINTFFLSIGNLLAPAVAGILFSAYGLLLILIANSISFLVSAVCQAFISIPRTTRAPEKVSFTSFVEDFKEGFSFVKSKRLIMILMFVALVANFAADPIFSVGYAFISKKILEVTDFQYGLLESVFVVSMILAPIIGSSILKKYDLAKLLFWVFLSVSILIAFLAVVPMNSYQNLFSTNLVPYITMILIVFLIGSAVTIANICLGTLFQKEVPIEIMGRVGTLLQTVSTAAMPLGRFLFGYLFDMLPAYICILIGASILFISMLSFKKVLYKNSYNIAESQPFTA